MSIHLFSTPVQCTNCGTVVDDPTVDRCPTCSALLRERRTPSRLAGVERRYGALRFLLGFLRFLGVITLLIGVLIFAFGVGDERMSTTEAVLTLVGGVLGSVVILAFAAFVDVILDMEENTRSAFRVQQLMLDLLQQGKTDTADRTG